MSDFLQFKCYCSEMRKKAFLLHPFVTYGDNSAMKMNLLAVDAGRIRSSLRPQHFVVGHVVALVVVGHLGRLRVDD